MTSPEKPTKGDTLPAPPSAIHQLVVRSDVPAGLEYPAYKPFLRRDFFCSCAYCTMTEAEAQAIRFTIDHYEPTSARDDLKDDYSNLMYACDECNMRKGDRCPPVVAREEGYRFFRPDLDKYGDHFEGNSVRVDAKSIAGQFTIETIDLNRASLRRLRDYRNRLTKCDRYVAEGIRGLRDFHIDQLPPHIKTRAANAIYKIDSMADSVVSEIDDLLRNYAKSPLLEPEDETELKARTAERKAYQQRLTGLFPGLWSGRQMQGKGKKSPNRKQ